MLKTSFLSIPIFRISSIVCAVWLTFPAVTLYGQASKGTVSGTVFDGQTSRPVIGVEILVNGQGSDRQKTGTDGAYRLELSPGKYTLKFSQENYFPVELTDVDVKAGEAVDGSTVMTAKGATTTVEVKESISSVTASSEAMLNERKLAPQV